MKVLVAINQAGSWPQIINALSQRSYPQGTQFQILTVLEPLPFTWELQTGDNWDKIATQVMHERKVAAQKMLTAASERLRTIFPDCTVHAVLLAGHAREEIIKATLDWMPNKLVLGAHGRSQNRLIAGSFPHDVARVSPCSVELIRLIEPAVELTQCDATQAKQQEQQTMSQR
jgi:nucleotide-binding universal stress UspA family protein